MADIKRAQHRGEQLLAHAENAIEAWSSETARPAHLEKLNAAWPDLLFTQFHDILAGTSAPQAWDGARAMQGRATLAADELLVEITRVHAKRALPGVNYQQIALYNPTDQAWKGMVEHEPFLDFDRWNDRWLSTPDGEPVPFQKTQPGACISLVNRVLFPVEIPARSAKIVLVRDDEPRAARFPEGVAASPGQLSNGLLEVQLNERGVARVLHNGAEAVGEIGLHLRKDASDTWSFVIDRYVEAIEETLQGLQWVVEESGAAPRAGAGGSEAR